MDLVLFDLVDPDQQPTCDGTLDTRHPTPSSMINLGYVALRLKPHADFVSRTSETEDPEPASVARFWSTFTPGTVKDRPMHLSTDVGLSTRHVHDTCTRKSGPVTS